MKQATIALCACLALVTAYTRAQAQDPGHSGPQQGEAHPISLPERKPETSTAPVHPGEVESADWTAQDIQEALDKCAMMLADTGVVYKPLDPIREGRCGTPAPVEVTAIGSSPSVSITPPARITCELAASLSTWSETVLQKTARAYLGTDITDIRNAASYVCRNRYNSAERPISEHARANAFDMAAFKTAKGDWITVLDHWSLPPGQGPEPDDPVPADLTVTSSGPEPGEPDTGGQPEEKNAEGGAEAADDSETAAPPVFPAEAAFLFDSHAAACSLFGTVLGPQANEAHRDHFHFDLAPRKHGNFCE